MATDLSDLPKYYKKTERLHRKKRIKNLQRVNLTTYPKVITFLKSLLSGAIKWRSHKIIAGLVKV